MRLVLWQDVSYENETDLGLTEKRQEKRCDRTFGQEWHEEC